MSSPAEQFVQRDISEPRAPSPLPLDVPPREIDDEGLVEGSFPPADVPGVEETEPQTALNNPLTADIKDPEPETQEPPSSPPPPSDDSNDLASSPPS